MPLWIFLGSVKGFLPIVRVIECHGMDGILRNLAWAEIASFHTTRIIFILATASFLCNPPLPPPHNSHLRMGFPHPHDHVLAHWEAASDGNDPLLWWTPIHCILGFHRIHFRSPRTTRLGILKGQESRLLSKAVAVKLAFGLHVVLCT